MYSDCCVLRLSLMKELSPQSRQRVEVADVDLASHRGYDAVKQAFDTILNSLGQSHSIFLLHAVTSITHAISKMYWT